jgi:hypothetical protein
MHWHHPTEAKTTLPFIYSFTIDVFGHIKMIVYLCQPCIPSVVLSVPLMQDSRFAWSPTMYRIHWHHPTAAKTTLLFIYSFTIDVFGHIKMIVYLCQPCIPSVVLSVPLMQDSRFAWSPTMYRIHWHHPTAAKTTLPFIYSFTINAFGHVKIIEYLLWQCIPSVVLRLPSLLLSLAFHSRGLLYPPGLPQCIQCFNGFLLQLEQIGSSSIHQTSMLRDALNRSTTFMMVL